MRGRNTPPHPAGTSAKALTPPQNTNQPTVYGTAVQGKTLFTTNGSWAGTPPISFRYRWLRCDASGGGVKGVNGATISGETRRMYVATSADVGHRIRSRLVATNADGTDSFNSNASVVVRAAPNRPSELAAADDLREPRRKSDAHCHCGLVDG